MNDENTNADKTDEDELIGAVLDDRFRLDEVIGAGGMGRVFRATQLSVERDVAVKVLHGELSLEEELRDRFFREAKVVSGFNHPNIVRLIDFGRDEQFGVLYLVMELIDGVGLEDLLERGRLAPELALRIAHQTCGALVEAHANGVIHRDLKAENLLLLPVSDGTLQAKVVDFGIAYPQDASKKLTMTGRIYGTASYMAPEQAQGMDVDERADLFSLGVMLFEMLTGKLPVEGTNSIEVMIKQIQEGPPPLSQVIPPGDLPEEVSDLVDSLLANLPSRRPQSAKEVRDALDAIFHAQNWQPIRLPDDTPRAEQFDRWLREPLDISQADAVERGRSDNPVDSRQPTVDHDANRRQGAENADPMAKSGRTKKGVGEVPDQSPPSPSQGGAPPNQPPETADIPSGPSPSAEPEDEGGGRGTLLFLAVAIGLFVLVAIPVGGYLALKYFQPETGSPLESIGTPGAASEEESDDPTPTDESERAATDEDKGEEPAEKQETKESESDDDTKKGLSGLETDPVCGRVDQVDIPSGWRGDFRPQGDGSGTLKVGARKLNARWDGGGATLWLSRTEMEGSQYTVSCSRYAGTGDGEKCSGTIRKRGPVLTVKLSGTSACEDRFSGAWLSK